MATIIDTIQKIFRDYSARRTGILRALTTEVDYFYQLCDPENESLCLYGHPNESWEVSKPAEIIPADLPVPVSGINVCRDMNLKGWLTRIAMHSDAWLISVAFLLGARARLTRDQRNHLFNLINGLPTILEVLTESWEPVQDEPSMSESVDSSSKGLIDEQTEIRLNRAVDSHEGAKDEHTDIRCRSCGWKYNPEYLWIFCHFCQKWYHGMCVRVTPALAKSIEKYKCPFCDVRGQPW